MLDCIDVFAREYDKKGDKLIIDRYELDKGLYLLVDIDSGNIINTLHVTKNNKGNRSEQKDFIQMDYLSRLIELNKPMGTKVIQSNNFLSFWIKVATLTPDKKTKKINFDIKNIDKYYDSFIDLESKLLKSKDDRLLYESISEDVGLVDIELLEKCREWVKDNLLTLVQRYNLTNSYKYIKIYFNAQLDLYAKESKRYLYPKLYNSNKYTTKIDNVIYGVPNNNFGLNAKKPFLMLKGRVNELPNLVPFEKALIQNKFYDYLLCLVNGTPSIHNLYVDEKLIPLADSALLDRDFSGVYIRFEKEKNEVEIKDFSVIPKYTPGININIEKIIYHNNPENRKFNLSYGKVSDLTSLRREIDNIFFNGVYNKFLFNNFYFDSADLKKLKIDSFVKDDLIYFKDSFIDMFYKNDLRKIRRTFEDRSLKIIIRSIKKNNYIRACEQFNLRAAILDYLKGDVGKLANKYGEIYKNFLSSLLNCEVTLKYDDEFYFAVGQVAYYLINKSKSNKVSLDSINIIDCQSPRTLKNKFLILYRKYRYAINLNSPIVSQALAAVLGYEPSGNKVNGEALNCGYLYTNAIYEAFIQKKSEKDVKDK